MISSTEDSSESSDSSGVRSTLVGSDDSPENSTKSAGESPAAQPNPAVEGSAPSQQLKKKRGRPRKYGPDGTVVVLSPKPIYAAAPPPPSVKPSSRLIKLNLPPGNIATFTPHILTVNAGEDVWIKIISFSQQAPRAICILTATGVISSVTLIRADSSGGTLTCEGRFEILSLSCSAIPNDPECSISRAGTMSVSLAGLDGRVVGGELSRLLIAASPIQIVVGCFPASLQQEQK